MIARKGIGQNLCKHAYTAEITIHKTHMDAEKVGP